MPHPGRTTNIESAGPRLHGAFWPQPRAPGRDFFAHALEMIHAYALVQFLGTVPAYLRGGGALSPMHWSVRKLVRAVLLPCKLKKKKNANERTSGSWSAAPMDIHIKWYVHVTSGGAALTGAVRK